jgi:outer membrane beta-barrel protein
MRNTSMKRLTMIAAAALSLTAPFFAHAQSANAKPGPAAPQDKKLDISDLENKYWAPKDTDFSVVQNRTYSKANRWFITPQYGVLVNDSYSTGAIYGVTGNYFFSERYGVQLSVQHADLKNSQVVSNLQSQFATGVAPDHDKLNNFYGLGFSFVPFYAKMSFMGERIMYFDMAITPVVGLTNYEQTTASGANEKTGFSYGIDLTQYFFLSRWFAIRADLTNHWTNENVVKFHNDQGQLQGAPAGTNNNLDTTFLLGFTFYF